MTSNSLHQAVLHLPVVTTFCAAFFCFQLFSRYRAKGGGLHLLWWGIGMATYGLGTFTEAYTTVVGWNPWIFRLWYSAGAFLGGYPLAQGSIYLLMNRRFAHRSAWVVSSVIAVASVLVFLAPLDVSLGEPHRLSGQVIQWHWLRLVSPFINTYSLIFLVGGAVVSAMRFRRAEKLRNRYIGNILIAIGALLPGIGGSMTRAGIVEALYITELIGLMLIYIGYRFNISGRLRPAGAAARADAQPAIEDRPMTKYALTLLLTAGLTLAAGAALAQSPAPPAAAPPAAAGSQDSQQDSQQDAKQDEAKAADSELKSFFETTTVTATGSEVSTFKISTPVSVISAKEIERKMPDNAVDLLRDEPGVDVNGVGPNQERPVIRGQRGLRVLFLENGLRMNNARRQTDFGEISGLVDIDNVERVEVVRGPASVLYGTDAIGGVLNLITKVPPYRDGSGVNGAVNLRYGSAGDLGSAQAAMDGGRDKVSFHLGLSYRDASDYSAPSGRFGNISLKDSVPVVDTGVRDDSIYGWLGYGLTDSQQLFLRYSRYRADETGFGFVEPALLGEGDDFRIRILYPYQNFDRYTLGYNASALESPLADSVEVQLYYQKNQRELANDIDINIGPIFPGAPDSSVNASTLNYTDLGTFGGRAELIKLAGQRHLITYGGEFFSDDSFNTDSSITTTTLRFFPGFEIVDVSTDTVANAPNATNSSYGVFLQDEITASDRLRFTLGGRYQKVDTKADSTPGWDVSGLDFSDDKFVGAINATYGVTDYLNVVGSYGTAFRAPNIIERLFNGPTPEGAGYQILNPDLVSENSVNYDVGLKYLRKNAVFEVSYFRNDIKEGIIQNFLSDAEIAALPPDVQAAINASGAQFVVQQVNAEKLRYDGLETVIGYRTRAGVSFGGNYTHLSGKRLDSTNPPTGDVVGDKYNGYVRYEPGRGRYWCEYRVRHNTSQRANVDPNEPLPAVGAELPAFTVHSLAAGGTLFERGRVRHSLTLVLDNLTNELYAEFSNATFFRPQPERSVSLSYRLGF